MVSLSDLLTGSLYPAGNIYGAHFSWVLSAAGRNKSMKNSNVTGNRTRDFPVCSVVPQPGAPPRAPLPVSPTFYNY